MAGGVAQILHLRDRKGIARSDLIHTAHVFYAGLHIGLVECPQVSQPPRRAWCTTGLISSWCVLKAARVDCLCTASLAFDLAGPIQ